MDHRSKPRVGKMERVSYRLVDVSTPMETMLRDIDESEASFVPLRGVCHLMVPTLRLTGSIGITTWRSTTEPNYLASRGVFDLKC